MLEFHLSSLPRFVPLRTSDAGQQTKELKPGKERSFRRRRKPKEEKRGE